MLTLKYPGLVRRRITQPHDTPQLEMLAAHPNHELTSAAFAQRSCIGAVTGPPVMIECEGRIAKARVSRRGPTAAGEAAAGYAPREAEAAPPAAVTMKRLAHRESVFSIPTSVLKCAKWIHVALAPSSR